jgi:putative ABC transport system substrate-binding protein
VEGRNLTVEYRWAEERLDRLPGLAADLVRRQVAAIVATSTASVLAAKAATQTIPIVFEAAVDPVEAGLVASLNRPGGNLTGISTLSIAVMAKRLELLHELIPAATSIAVLVNPTNAVFAETQRRELQIAAGILGVHLLILNASDPSEFEAAFATLVHERASGLVESGEALFLNHSDRLVAARYSVPVMYGDRRQTAAGGLMSYGTNRPDAYRQVGFYTGRILKSEKPANLPVQLVTKMQLAIHMGTAKALGLTFPITLLGRADEVIQ